MPQLVSTNVVAPRDRLSFWIDSVCAVYVHLDCATPLPRDGFSGEITHGAVGSLACSRVASLAQRVSRTPAQIAKETEGWILASIQTRGEGWVRQDGREARLLPGDCAIYDSTRPYELWFGAAFEQAVLKIPASWLGREIRGVERLTATTIAGARGPGRLLSAVAASAMHDLDAIGPASAHPAASGIVGLLVAALRSLPSAQAAAVSNLTALHRARARAFVLDHLANPALNVAQVARAIGVSESTLHRAFRDEPCSLAQWMWSERLEAVRRDLSDPALAKRTVSDIAFARGFNDASHFSRAFKARFGSAPGTLRRPARR